MTETPFGMGPESRERREAPSRFEVINREIAELDRRESLSLAERERRRELRDQRAEMGRKARSLGVFSVAEGALNQIFEEAEKREDPTTYIAQQRELIDSIESGTRKSSVFRLRKGVEEELGGAAAYYFNRGIDHMEVVFLESAGLDIKDIKEIVEPEDWEWKIPKGPTAGERTQETRREEPQENYQKKEKMSGIELPRTPEELKALVRQQLLEWMENVTQNVYTEDWLDGKWIRGVRGLTLGGILKELEGGMPEADVLKNEIKAIQALHKRYTLQYLNRFSFDGISTMTQEAEKVGAILTTTERSIEPVRHLEVIANLMPEKEGDPLVGDIVSRLFLAYRAMALSESSSKNLFKLSPEEASDEKIKEIREGVRKSLGGKNKNSLTYLYADEIALRLMRVLGEAGWGDTEANGPVAGLDALSHLMHFGKYREKQAKDNKHAGPKNTLEIGSYPPHLLVPFSRMLQLDSAGVKRYIWEFLDEGKLLRDLPLGQVRGADGYFLFRLGQAAKLATKLLDTEGKDTDFKGLAELNGVVKIALSKDLIQTILDPKKSAKEWEKDKVKVVAETEKWTRRVKYNYISGLRWVLAYPRGPMSHQDFLHKVIHPAVAAGVIAQEDADEISGYDWLGAGWAGVKTLLGLRKKP